MGDIALAVDGRMSVEQANDISNKVEGEAKKLFDEIYEIIVKFEPDKA